MLRSRLLSALQICSPIAVGAQLGYVLLVSVSETISLVKNLG